TSATAQATGLFPRSAASFPRALRWRSTAAMRAPSAASARATARPMPLAAPVIRATRSLKRSMAGGLLWDGGHGGRASFLFFVVVVLIFAIRPLLEVEGGVYNPDYTMPGRGRRVRYR